MKKAENQTEYKQIIWEILANFGNRMKMALVALYQRLKKWPVGWLINLGLTILILILLLIMLITFYRGEKGVSNVNGATVEQASKVDDCFVPILLEEKLVG